MLAASLFLMSALIPLASVFNCKISLLERCFHEISVYESMRICREGIFHMHLQSSVCACLPVRNTSLSAAGSTKNKLESEGGLAKWVCLGNPYSIASALFFTQKPVAEELEA